MKKNIFTIITVATLLMTALVSCDENIQITDVIMARAPLTLMIGETSTLSATVVPPNADQTLTWESDNAEVATVDQTGTVTAIAKGWTVITATASDGKHKAKCGVLITPKDTEDSGIVINGVKWATRNVDAPGRFAAQPKDAGMFYQWNKRVGWSVSYPMINSDGGTTWDSSVEGDIWEKANDPCPAGWRLPTFSELENLANTNSQWRTISGVNGRTFNSGDSFLFLPAAGFRYYGNGMHNSGNLYGYYWSGTIDDYSYSFNLNFSIKHINTNSNHNCAYGYSIRCVAE